MQTNYFTPKQIFSKLGIAFTFGIIINFYFQFMFVFFGKIFFPEFLKEHYYLMIMILTYVLSMPLLLFFLSKVPTESDVLEKKKISFVGLAGWFCVLYAAMWITNVISTLGLDFVSFVSGKELMNNIPIHLQNSVIWQNVLFTTIIAPIYEELIFRKTVIDKLHKYGDVIAILTSSIIFCLYHGNIFQLFYTFAVGLVLGYMYIRYGNIYYTMILHSILNFVGSVATVLVLRIEEQLGSNSILFEFSYIFIVMTIVFTGIFLFFHNKKHIILEEGSEIIPKELYSYTFVFNPGLLVMFIFFILYIFYPFFS